MTMIERVADAVLADLLKRRGVGHELESVLFDDETWQKIRQAVGRAAIATLREPTPEMIRAGAEEVRAFDPDRDMDDAIAAKVHQAMIDAALGEGE